MCGFVQSCCLEPSMKEVVLFLMVILLFSDCFMDASVDTLQVPVRSQVVRCISLLIRGERALQQAVVKTTDRLQATHNWKRKEEWIWYYDMALLLAIKESFEEKDLVLLCEWLQFDDYAIHHLLLQTYCVWWRQNAPLCSQYLETLVTRVEHLLATHNFLSEWCCALPDYLRLVGIAMSEHPSALTASYQEIASCGRLERE